MHVVDPSGSRQRGVRRASEGGHMSCMVGAMPPASRVTPDPFRKTRYTRYMFGFAKELEKKPATKPLHVAGKPLQSGRCMACGALVRYEGSFGRRGRSVHPRGRDGCATWETVFVLK